MEDNEIVQLYWERNEKAIVETDTKYKAYCNRIAMNILNDSMDAEECVNDTYMKVWNSIPPNKPKQLSTFIGKITRNLSFDVYRKKHTDKRGNGQIDLILEEMSEMISGGVNPEHELSKKELISDINLFLGKMPRDKRILFVRRYWYADSIEEIAKQFRMTENNVSVNLARIRGKLKKYLVARGYYYGE